jgi:hypothetical protein
MGILIAIILSISGAWAATDPCSWHKDVLLLQLKYTDSPNIFKNNIKDMSAPANWNVNSKNLKSSQGNSFFSSLGNARDKIYQSNEGRTITSLLQQFESIGIDAYQKDSFIRDNFIDNFIIGCWVKGKKSDVEIQEMLVKFMKDFSLGKSTNTTEAKKLLNFMLLENWFKKDNDKTDEENEADTFAQTPEELKTSDFLKRKWSADRINQVDIQELTDFLYDLNYPNSQVKKEINTNDQIVIYLEVPAASLPPIMAVKEDFAEVNPAYKAQFELFRSMFAINLCTFSSKSLVRYGGAPEASYKLFKVVISPPLFLY